MGDQDGGDEDRRSTTAGLLVLTTEERVAKRPDGTLVTRSGLGAADWRARWPNQRLTVAARVWPATEAETAGARAAEGDEVAVRPMPNWSSVLGMVRCVVPFYRLSGAEGLYLCDVPGMGGLLLALCRRLRRRPYAVHVVGDIDDVLASPGVGGRAARLYAPLIGAITRSCVRHAAAAAFVTRRYLQYRYPASPTAVAACFSFISVPEVPPPARREATVTRVVTVCSLEQPYKGVEHLLRALAGDEVGGLALTIVGDGRLQSDYRSLADQLGVGDRVVFTGHLAERDAVRRQLRGADLFVLASLTEGLPRALIEAMAEGLACVATSVGGIPELLPPECLVPPGDPEALRALLAEYASGGREVARESRRNIERVAEFRPAAMAAARQEFLDRAMVACRAR